MHYFSRTQILHVLYFLYKMSLAKNNDLSLDIFAEEKSFLNWPENLPLKYQALVSGHPV